MQSPRKEQEAEHSLHQGLVKINLPNRARQGLIDLEAREYGFEGNNAKAGNKRHDQKANRMGQLNISAVQP